MVDSHFAEEVEEMPLVRSASFRWSCIVLPTKFMYLVDQHCCTKLACSGDTFGILNYYSLYIRIVNPRGIIYIVFMSASLRVTRSCRVLVHRFLGQEQLLQEIGRAPIAYTRRPICATKHTVLARAKWSSMQLTGIKMCSRSPQSARKAQ